MKKITFKSLLVFIIAGSFFNGFSQQIYNNGDISTGSPSTNGTAAPTGYTWSELQSPNTILGSGSAFNNAGTSSFALADDFTVPAGEVWDLTSVDFYGYQTGYTGSTIPIDALRVRIWNGDPTLPTSTVVFGDMTTNVLDVFASGEAFVYRTGPTPGTTRKIWKFTAPTLTSLPAGVYWIEYQVHAINDAGLFAPAVTVLGETSNPDWNAKQRSIAAWSNLIDTGSTFARAVSFQLNGTITLGTTKNELDANVTIVPNPITSIFTIKANSTIELSKVEVLSVDGKILKTVLGQFAAVDIESLAAGNYFVKLYSDSGIAVKKIIKI
jgi:Secretion system C-terminal sorting domain